MAPPKDARQTITSSKSAFLTSQIRLLDTPLTTPTSNISLPDAAVDKIVTSVNKKVAQQNKLVYSLESRRHVLEQVDGVYWRDVLAAGLPVSKAETIVKKEIDLQNAGAFGARSLPEAWEDVVLDARPVKRLKERHNSEEGSQQDFDDEPEEEKTSEVKYGELREGLISQIEKRDKLQRRMAQYKQLQTLLRPLENPRETVQPNLVTRDNKELEQELAKMKVLLARVGHAIQQQPARAPIRQDGTAVATSNDKLEDLLDLGWRQFPIRG